MPPAKGGRFKYKPPQKIVPLDPDKPLCPPRTPTLKTFDRKIPGQLVLDLSGDGEIGATEEETSDAVPRV
jgi:hypothetical protein